MKHTQTSRRRTWPAIAASAAALLFVAACGTESDAPGVGDNTDNTEDTAAPGGECTGADGEFLIGMSQANVAEPYRQQMDDDIRAAAEDVAQFEVVFADAAQDNSKQVADVENFLSQGIDLLIISPNEAAPLTAIVERAYNEDIPVIVLDRKIEGDSYTQFIGADNLEIGKAAGEYVATELLPDGGNVAEIRGLSGSTPAQERADGFREGIAGTDGIEIIAESSGDWIRELGQSQADAILQANADIDVFYAHNDPMAEGAYLAASSAGRDGEIEFIGIDGLPIPSGGIKAVEEGRLSATFVYPTGGREAIDTAQQILLECADVEKEVTLETQLVTADNAAEVYAELGGQ